MAKRKPVSPADIQDVELAMVRHSDLGRDIEALEDELIPLEDLHRQLQDAAPTQAMVIRLVLERIDALLDTYKEVR